MLRGYVMRLRTNATLFRVGCLLVLLHGHGHARGLGLAGQAGVQQPGVMVQRDAVQVPARPLEVVQATFPDAALDLPYRIAIQASGGAGDCRMTWSGDLPPGLSVDTGSDTLALGGIPTAEGTYAFKVTATEPDGSSASGEYTIRVDGRPVQPIGKTTVSVPVAEVVVVTDAPLVFFPAKIGVSEQVIVTDAISVFFPAVIKVSESVVVTDAVNVFFPAKINVSEAVVVTDAVKVMGSVEINVAESVVVSDAASVVAEVGVTPTTAPAGTYKVAYLAYFAAAGADGTATLTPAGTLPSGMYFQVVSGEVKLFGTPTQTGTFPFTIKVQDSVHTNTVSYTLVINPATQTITFGAAPTPTYGGAPFTVSATSSSGLPVTITAISGPVTGSNPYTITGAGTAVFEATQAGNADYSAATPMYQDVTIAQAPLYATAGNASRVFDQPNPGFGYSLSGFVNGDNGSVVSGAPVLSTSAVPVSPAGNYAIALATGTLSAANYYFVDQAGTLTVTAAPQTITFYALPVLTHGGAAFPLTARASSGLAVTYSVTGPASISNSMLTVSGAGPVSVTAAQAGNGNYGAATSVTRSFTAK